jgi:hypothetical protein
MYALAKLPAVPYVGMRFQPHGINNVGTILRISNTDVNGNPIMSGYGYKGTVTYSYAHDPKTEWIEQYSYVRGIGHAPFPTV